MYIKGDNTLDEELVYCIINILLIKTEGEISVK